MAEKIKIKNTGTSAMEIGINLQKICILSGEEAFVEPEVLSIIRNSVYKDSVMVLEGETEPIVERKHSNHEDIFIEKIQVDFRMPLEVRNIYDGYGRLSTLFSTHLNFNEDSDTLVITGHPRKYVRQRPNEKVIFFTMFEADKIPERWVEFCNDADGLIVPTYWVKSVFEKSGVKKPIEVVPLGTDNFEIIKPEYSKNKKFRFLHQNSFIRGDQKGWKLTLKAFINVFGDDPNVELILKGRVHKNDNDMDSLPQQENIRYIVEDMERHEFDALMKQVHCFVFPSRGEGFGLPPIEMMARGVPTILTNAHSMKAFAEYGIPIRTTGEMTPSYYVGRVWDSGIGSWVTPDIRDLEKAMRSVYENYPEYKKTALLNQKIIKSKFSLDKMFSSFINAVGILKQ